MKIKEVTEEAITFDNGNYITYYHCQDCCERNYADFESLTPNNVNYDFDFEEDLEFAFVDGVGFMFGSDDDYGNMHWILIPCYSEQNGYYTTTINIHYNTSEGKKLVAHGCCEEHIH